MSYEDLIKQYPAEELWISETLLRLGVPQNLKGYKYIVTGLLLCLETPTLPDCLSRGLYPAIADVWGLAPHQVERTIRRAVEVAWDNGDPEVGYEFFGNSISHTKYKPTNGVFIATVLNKLNRYRRGVKLTGGELSGT